MSFGTQQGLNFGLMNGFKLPIPSAILMTFKRLCRQMTWRINRRFEENGRATKSDSTCTDYLELQRGFTADHG